MIKHFSFGLVVAVLGAVALAHPRAAADATSLGYYRYPAIHGDTLVFTAEGDLWRVSVNGGVAQRLTTHPAEESRAAIAPDGKTIAFSAAYEGPTEVYTVPIEGGFVRPVWHPALDFLASVDADRDADGHLIVDGSGRTSVDGLYAAGDAAAPGPQQLIVAAGQGARAAAVLVHDLVGVRTAH